MKDNTTNKVSNQSASKASISNLLNNDIDPLHVQQISGHKRLEGLNRYNSVSLSVQKKISQLSLGVAKLTSAPTSFVPPSNDLIASIFSGANINNIALFTSD